MDHLSKLSNGPYQTRQLGKDSQRCNHGAFGCSNIILIGIGLVLVGLAAYGKQQHFVTLPAFVGFVVSGIVIILLSIVGFNALPRQDQVLVYTYLVAMAFLLVVHLSFNIESFPSNHKRMLGKREGSASHVKEENHMDIVIKCCELENGETREEWCKNLLPFPYNSTVFCHDLLNSTTGNIVQFAFGVGLFFGYMLFAAVYVTVKFCNSLRKPGNIQQEAISEKYFII